MPKIETYFSVKTNNNEVNNREELQENGNTMIATTIREHWKSSHVKLPCSERNGKQPGQRWNFIVSKLKRKIQTLTQLENILIALSPKAYKRSSTCFQGLVEVLKKWEQEQNHPFQNIINILPNMQDLALELYTLFPQGIMLLRQRSNRELRLSRKQIACIMANAFFGTFPRRDPVITFKKKDHEYHKFPSINLYPLFKKHAGKRAKRIQEEKLKCIFQYFDSIAKGNYGENEQVVYHRYHLNYFPDFLKSTLPLSNIKIMETGAMEDYETISCAKTDFANKYIGGGVIGQGLVQEEIQFLIHPECIASRLFTEVLLDQECLIIRGALRFSNYSGYSSTFKWEGENNLKVVRNKNGYVDNEIIAIDAINFYGRSISPQTQYRGRYILRETKKAYVGFLKSDHLHIASGNWGCGAFGGNVELKSLIQWIAYSVALPTKRDSSGGAFLYFSYGDSIINSHFEEIIQLLKQKGVIIKDLFEKLLTFKQAMGDSPNLTVFQHIVLSFATLEETKNFSVFAKKVVDSSSDEEETTTDGALQMEDDEATPLP